MKNKQKTNKQKTKQKNNNSKQTNKKTTPVGSMKMHKVDMIEWQV